MVDNFDQIAKLLEFKTSEDFYFVQVIQRKKDHKEENKRLGRNNNARLVKAYYIRSVDYLMEHRPEIIALCNTFNARAGISLNPRNAKKVALDMMARLAHCIKTDNYEVQRLYNTACGMVIPHDRTWIIDIDTKDEKELQTCVEFVTKAQPEGEKIIARIPSKEGLHLITRRFHSDWFLQNCPVKVEIHKNNPTNLYIP